MSLIYLDYNATTPVLPEVLEVMRHALIEGYGNPSSPHSKGIQARRIVEEARRHVAQLIHAQPEEIVFTSGGSESNNHAIKGVSHALREKGRHLITSSIEHPAVTHVCRFLEGEGCDVTVLSVTKEGLVRKEELDKALGKDTVLVSIMHANNETGTVQPIAELSALAGERGVLFHTDAAQSIGKIPVDVNTMGVDLLSMAGHKLYAPKGVGALFIRKGVSISPLIHGASHERGLRAGTENVPEIAGLGKACEIALRDLEKRRRHLKRMRDRLHFSLLREVPDLILNGHPEDRLPNTLNVSFPGLNAPALIEALPHLAVSAGSACHATGVDPSPVLVAMGIPTARALGTLRFSTGHFTTEEEIDTAASLVCGAVKKLRG